MTETESGNDGNKTALMTKQQKERDAQSTVDHTDIYSLCTPEEIQSAIRKLCQEEDDLECQLERHLSERYQLSARLAALPSSCPDLDLLLTDAHQLGHMIEVTSQLARQVSAKVKLLDLAKTRVAECQSVVNDLLEVKSCADSVRQALADEHYERATAHVHRFLSIRPATIALLTADTATAAGATATDGAAADEDDDDLVASVTMLQRAESRLITVVSRYFSQAVQADDTASVERFFKMFPLLQQHDEGIAQFSSHLCQKLEAAATKVRREAAAAAAAAAGSETDSARAAALWVETFTMLYETVAKLVEVQQPIIETFYGPGWLLDVVAKLHTVCSSHAALLMNSFNSQRQIVAKVEQAKRVLRGGSSNNNNISSSGDTTTTTTTAAAAAGLDIRQLDMVLTEMALVRARSEIYMRFVRRRVTADIDAMASEQSDAACAKLTQLRQLLASSQLNIISQNLIDNYITLESYYMTESLRKAVRLDSVDLSTMTSCLVDDAFFIVKKCLRRAISSESVDGMCALLNISCHQLDRQLVASVLESRLRHGFPSGHMDLSHAYSALQSSLQQGRLSAGSADTDQIKAQFLTALNNAHTSRQYLDRLCDELSADFVHITSTTHTSATSASASGTSQQELREAGGGESRDSEKLRSCLAGLRQLSERLAGVVQTAVKQLRTGAIRSRVKPWLETLTSTSHIITECDLARYEAEDRFVGGVIAKLDTLLNSISSLLLPDVGQMLKLATLNEVATQLEKVILKCTYNRYGGLQLDKEVRALVGYLLSVTSWAERDQLSRINQIASLLNMEQVSEVLEMRGVNSNISWKLSPNEIRKIMSLRVDFKAEEVRRLKL